VLQPRRDHPTSTNRSFFRVFAGDVGLDLYTRAVSDVSGPVRRRNLRRQGIYDIDAFGAASPGASGERAAQPRRFGGIRGRARWSGQRRVEDYPARYLVAMSRQRRWVRGDWQLLPWLFPRVPSASMTSESPGVARRKTIANDLM
jgi:cyclic beta-1,2-glucan synthetase